MSTSIYDELRDFQSSESVPSHGFRAELNRIAKAMVETFRLGISDYVIGIGKLRVNRLGQYRYERNDLGLRAEILISEAHIRECMESDQEWQIYGTVLHELDHAWQEAHGKPGKNNYHNKQFRMKAAEQGLIIDEKGHTQYDPGSPFFDFLTSQQISFPPLATPKLYHQDTRGKSTLARWMCMCEPPQLARVGRRDFQAVCPVCNCCFSTDE